MALVKFTVNKGNLGKVADKIKALGSVAMRTEINRKIAKAMAEQVQQSFDSTTSPYGEKWRPLKRGTRKPLHKTLRLKKSYKPKATASTASVVSNVPYGSFQNEGTRTIPRRQHVPTASRGVPAKLRAAIEKAVVDTVRKRKK